MTRQADVLDASSLEECHELGDPFLDRALGAEAERRNRLVAGHPVVAGVLELKLRPLDLQVRELRLQAVRQIGDPHVHGMKVEDPCLPRFECLDVCLRHVLDVKERATLVSTEHAYSPVRIRLYREDVYSEIHANPRDVIRDAEQRSQTKHNRFSTAQTSLGP